MPRSVDWVWRPWESTEIKARWCRVRATRLHDSMAFLGPLCGGEPQAVLGSYWALVGAVRGLSTVADYQGADIVWYVHPWSGLPWWLSDKEPAHQEEDVDSIPGSERPPEEGNGTPLQCSCLGSLMDRGVHNSWGQKESDTT